MAIGLIMQFNGIGQAEYDDVMRELGLGTPSVTETDEWPDGILSHIAGPSENGWCVVDVWESQERFDAFFEGRLGPAFKAVGTIPEPQVTAVNLYNTHWG